MGTAQHYPLMHHSTLHVQTAHLKGTSGPGGVQTDCNSSDFSSWWLPSRMPHIDCMPMFKKISDTIINMETTRNSDGDILAVTLRLDRQNAMQNDVAVFRKEESLSQGLSSCKNKKEISTAALVSGTEALFGTRILSKLWKCGIS